MSVHAGETPWRIRPAGAPDKGFVFAHWQESLFTAAKAAINRFVTRHGGESLGACRIRVACDRDDEDTLLGFSVLDAHDPALLHYAYVRKELRNEGIGTALVRPDDVRLFTFRTDDIERFRPAERGWAYEPRITL